MNIQVLIRPVLLYAALVCCCFSVWAGDFEGVQALAERRVSWLAGHLVFRRTGSAARQGMADRFVLRSEDEKIVIEATNANAAAEGLNWYLKYYCHRSMSHMGDNLSAVYPLPVVKDAVTMTAGAIYRQALNYCTYNYTMSFYSWEQWEHELDWMALNGVNLMLVAGGEEAVWQNVLKRLGYTQKEIDDYITGPAYNAWWLMGNIQGWGGPMPQSQIDSRKELVQKMLARMGVLGIEPIMPGFFGMVPSTLKEKLRAAVFVQGSWGAFTRPDILDPADPAFDKVADLFYEETKKCYGGQIHYFSGDPFHEGGQTTGTDLGKVGVSIQQAMQRNFPASVWILQGWQDNPKKELLSLTDRSSILVQELFGENTSNWETRKGYEGTPFLWCTVTNFGERPGLSGKLQRFADEVHRAYTGPYAPYMKGVGIMPEGIDNNPVVYELVLELAWRGGQKTDVSDWIEGYIRARYGKSDASISQAWKYLLQTVYNSTPGYQEGPPENILCARPALAIKSVSSWGTIKKNYDRTLFRRAVQLFSKALPRFRDSRTYRLDLINFCRQEIANRADSVFENLLRAFHEKDPASFKAGAGTFLRMIDTTDDLLNTDACFRLNTYRQSALDAGHTEGEKKNNLLNALMLITYWGGNNRKEDYLHDYAYKEWSGLLRGFYKKRWELYFNFLNRQLTGDTAAAAPDFFAWERSWVNNNLAIDKEPAPKDLSTLIDELYPAGNSGRRLSGEMDVVKDGGACGDRCTEWPKELPDPQPGNQASWAGLPGEVMVSFASPDIRYKKSEAPAINIPARQWKVAAWRGEKVNTQVLLWGNRATSGVRLRPGPLRSKAGILLPASQVTYGFVRYVMTDGLNKDGGGCGVGAAAGSDSSLVADGIDFRPAKDVARNTVQPIWISIEVPQTLPAGIYSGTLRVTGQGLSRTLSYQVDVKAHLLPAPGKWTYHADLWQNPYAIARVHGTTLWSKAHFAAMKPYMKMLAAAGQKTITVSMIYDPWRGQTYDIYGSMIKWIKKKDNGWKYDYTIFDRWVGFMMQQGIGQLINCYTMVPWNNKFYYYDEACGKDTLLIAPIGSPEYNAHWRPMLMDFRRHLKAKGWFERTSIAMDERALEDMQKVIVLVKGVDTAFKISLAGSYHAGIEKDIYDYSIGFADHFDSAVLQGRIEKGLPTTYYTSCVEGHPNTFTFSSPAEAEWLGWYAANRHYNGYLRWAYNCWPSRPMLDSRFSTWGAGDTYFIYPGAGSSIRFERLREGIRDYEKIRLLKAFFIRTHQMGRLERLRAVVRQFDSESLASVAAAEQLQQATKVLNELSGD